MGEACGCLMIWNPYTNQSRPGPVCPIPRVLASVVACNDKLYALGGMTRIEWGMEQTDCAVYDPKTGVWQRIPSLPNNGMGLDNEEDAQYCHSMGACVVGNCIYVLGCQHNDFLATARVLNYDTIRNKWSQGTPMPEGRVHPECHAVGNNSIYVFGGQDGSSDKRSKNTWKYSTETNTWTALANAPKDHDDIMVPNGKGQDLCFMSVSVENKAGELKYHVATDTWEKESGAGLPGVAQGHMYGCGVCTAWF